jgi:hypothetical protein
MWRVALEQYDRAEQRILDLMSPARPDELHVGVWPTRAFGWDDSYIAVPADAV